ncbi:MAG TPA: MGMT family protein [Candidatus Acidoferrales bacterium]|jgi:methylated-DNA-protein-cysteine methyltransferase-like protein|nr:MGMT family protein [Candidatus Acidoferrales bacterium]
MEKTNSTNWNSVYALVKKIPRGRVITYGQLAKALRLSGGARTAGRAMSACPSGKGVPWHRVVGAGGKLLIREPYASLQRKLLESEGLELAEKHILNFKQCEWNAGGPRRRG